MNVQVKPEHSKQKSQ